jgi:hypothetical protein
MARGPVERHSQSSCTRQAREALAARVCAILFAPASIASKLIPILPCTSASFTHRDVFFLYITHDLSRIIISHSLSTYCLFHLTSL